MSGGATPRPRWSPGRLTFWAAHLVFWALAYAVNVLLVTVFRRRRPAALRVRGDRALLPRHGGYAPIPGPANVARQGRHLDDRRGRDPTPVFVPVLMRGLGNSPRGVSEGGAEPRPETHHATPPGPPRRPYRPARQRTPPGSAT